MAAIIPRQPRYVQRPQYSPVCMFCLVCLVCPVCLVVWSVWSVWLTSVSSMCVSRSPKWGGRTWPCILWSFYWFLTYLVWYLMFRYVAGLLGTFLICGKVVHFCRKLTWRRKRREKRRTMDVNNSSVRLCAIICHLVSWTHISYEMDIWFGHHCKESSCLIPLSQSEWGRRPRIL